MSRLGALATIRRHRHRAPYATIVLSGGYEEAGESGRHEVQAGDVLIHPPFSAHCDRILRCSAEVLDIPLPMDGQDWPRRGRVADPDRLVRLAERDESLAAQMLLAVLVPDESRCDDLPDRLARDLDMARPPAIAAWADRNGIARETLTRQFRQLYDVAPAHFRVELRARRAWRTIVQERRSTLADIASACGYADQPQLTREVRALTGSPPGTWRKYATSRSHSFKTG
ncbi:helix-turn-helix transcriptional regulator [Parasphingopyxis sp. GrpM-11]|uniref:Helix-turn-helix transcriptional regulator n=1 Tax=Parasphingopyxis marina TaxID=2761622 RepID=A0A842I224_9SPHN|nr:helix-turn-helix transcriptional regulator [Parasphingopyxis marina]